MTNTQKYEQVIYNLIELMKSKDLEIYICNSRIKSLEEQLQESERKEITNE